MYNFYVTQEFCKGGKLFKQIESLPEITENNGAEIIRQILSAIVYLHSKNLIYKGLSLDVLLLETNDNINDAMNLKLIDIDIQAALSTVNE
jgi:serine/threonine protein kinase